MKRKEAPAELSLAQKNLLLGIILTDATVEAAKTPKSNTRLQFNQGVTNKHVFDAFYETMGDFISETPKEMVRSAPLPGGKPGERTEKKYLVYQVRTLRCEALTKYCKNFVNQSGKKVMPSYNFLTENLSWESFAWMIMGDGSAHSSGVSQGMKLHLQSSPLDEQSRLCLALYHRLGIQCWPAYHKTSARTGEKQYHVRISGRSLYAICKNALPYMLDKSKVRIPPLLPNGGKKTPSNEWLAWYKDQLRKKAINGSFP